MSGTTARRARTHRGWASLAAFTAAFAVFEVAKHRGWTLPGALLGAALPLAAVTAPVKAVVQHPAAPLTAILGVLVPMPHAAAVALFTLTLAWLTHVSVLRMRRVPTPVTSRS
jgi:5,10-methenyltetrahydromethanopterin hydrogenase